MPLYALKATIMPPNSSDSDDENITRTKLFGRQKPIHAALGGGKVADLLLWRDKRLSAAILIGIGVIWFLFEVAEYNLVTLLCHIFITTMLALFIWSTGAEMFKWPPPEIPKIMLHESTFNQVAATFHTKFNELSSSFLYVACGNDKKLFLLVLVSLWIVSLVGNYINPLNLLFSSLVCMKTLPFLYERYEEEVDYAAYKINRRMRKLFRKYGSNVLERIPRGPVKDKKVT